MSQSTHQIKVKGVDQTGGAFSSIKNRAAATGAQVRSMLGGALAAAGAYLGFRAVKGGIDELGHLSDIAQKTSTSVGELTQTAAAMSALGIQNMGVDQLAKTFDFLAKNTGRTGMAGFYQTIGEIGKLPNAADRAQAAMKAFGRSGMELMPLINAADTSVEALQTVVAAMPKIPQAAADAGDAMSDAMGFAASQAKSIWLQGLASICGWFDNEYKGGVREASLAAGNYMEFYAKTAVAKCITWYRKTQEYLKRFGDWAGTFVGAKMAGASWGEAWNMAGQAYDEAVKDYDEVAKDLEKREAERTARFRREFEDRKIAIQKFQGAYDQAAISIQKRQMKAGADAEALAVKAPTIRNELVMGGNEANRIAVLGPQLQNETKKQTGLLEQIAANTKDTADNTEESADQGSDFKEIN